MSDNHLFFLRRAESEANAEGLAAGGGWDVGLSAKGIEDARIFAQENQSFLKNVDQVFLSGMKRTRLTADIIFENLAPKIEVIEDLNELNVGELVGQKTPKNLHELARTDAIPGAEKYQDFLERIIKAFKYCAVSQSTQPLIVGHGWTWMVMTESILGKAHHPTNCSLCNIDRSELED